MRHILVRALLAIAANFSCSPLASGETITVGPYSTTLTVGGGASAEATSENSTTGTYTEAITSAFSTVGANAQSSAYAEAESTLHVTGGAMNSDVAVTVHYALEIFGRKSAVNSIASANSLIDITDITDPDTIIWEKELDLHLTGGSTLNEQGDITVMLTDTITLKSGHSYIVALESFAEATAFTAMNGEGGVTLGWARAEAEADPTFSIEGANPEGFGLNHVVVQGSSNQTTLEPSCAIDSNPDRTLTVTFSGLIQFGADLSSLETMDPQPESPHTFVPESKGFFRAITE